MGYLVGAAFSLQKTINSKAFKYMTAILGNCIFVVYCFCILAMFLEAIILYNV